MIINGHYRGQITPNNKLIEVQAHIKSRTDGNRPKNSGRRHS